MKKIFLLITITIIISSFIYAAGPAKVDLGTSDNFAILAKTGVSTTGTTAIIGDIGVSPAAATYITGFSNLTMDVTNRFSTADQVVGKIYASNYSPPTPVYLTTAIGDMETAYTDAAGRTNPDATELHNGNFTNKTIYAGLYKHSTGVLINAGGAVTLAGTAEDVWIFQIAGNLVANSGAQVTLTGGALAENVFWQVSGQTTIETTADFKGNILCYTLIEIKTGATVNGRLLAQEAVTLDANNIIQPYDASVPIANDESEVPNPSNTKFRNFGPSPSTESTTTKLRVDKGETASITIYNLLGQVVAKEEFSAGEHNYTFSGRDTNGKKVANGIYFVNMVSPTLSKSFKIIKMK